MKRREFLYRGPVALWSLAPSALASPISPTRSLAEQDEKRVRGLAKPTNLRKQPFKRLVILGESMVSGGGGRWLQSDEQRYADILVRLINVCQDEPLEYHNKGIGGNAISPRSPGYPQSTKPSALERYQKDVIDLKPDLFILAYGTNDMVAGMPIPDFREDMAHILADVKRACAPVTVLTTIYYMTGWKSWPPYDKGTPELAFRYNDCIRSLAEEFGCILADVWAAAGGADWLIHYDGAHANSVGCMLTANRIFEAICQHASCLTDKAFAQVRDTDWSRMAIRKRAEFGDPFTQTW